MGIHGGRLPPTRNAYGVPLAARPPRHFAAWGSANRYKPVSSNKASGSSGRYDTHTAGASWARATKAATTVAVKTIYNQRWTCLIRLFQLTVISSEHERPEALSRLLLTEFTLGTAARALLDS